MDFAPKKGLLSLLRLNPGLSLFKRQVSDGIHIRRSETSYFGAFRSLTAKTAVMLEQFLNASMQVQPELSKAEPSFDKLRPRLDYIVTTR